MKYVYYSILFVFLVLNNSCANFLDVKPDEKLTVPQSLDDYNAILNSVDDVLAADEAEVMGGDYYIPDDALEGVFNCETNFDLYRWKDTPMIQKCNGGNGWTNAYNSIFRANVVINGVAELETMNGISLASSAVKGRGYFNRAVNYFEIAQIWTDAYVENSAKNKLGIALKYSSDFNEPTIRATLDQTFAQILADLQQAEALLPSSQNSVYLPTKTAASAYLARIYLYMNKYDKAAIYAEKCLDSPYKLFDYSKVSVDNRFPFDLKSNPEVIFVRFLGGSYYSNSVYANQVLPDLYKIYDNKDFRKSLFFRTDGDDVFFRGDYGGGAGEGFHAPTIGEIYLILAECYARMDRKSEAIAKLTEFLKYRTEEIKNLNSNNVLDEVLIERRKELLFRGVRFADVKRLNSIGTNITLKRTIRGQQYQLTPNAPQYTLLIPEDVINISGIPQNPR